MNSKINTTMGLAEWLLILLLSALWGASFFLGKVAVAGATNLLLATFLIPVSALLLTLLRRRSGTPAENPAPGKENS